MPQIKAFCGPSYESPAFRADVEQTINSYSQVVESAGAVAQRVLLPIPGKQTFATSGLAPIRAMFAQDGRRFAIIGFGFVEIDSAGVVTLRGTVNNDGLPGTISSSGDAGGELFIVAGGTGYCYNLLTNVLTAVAAAGVGLVQGGYLDGFFWTLDATSTFHLSNLLDGLTWDPLQTAQRNDAPDRWSAGMTIGKYIWLWGSETTSVLYDSGAFPFPFTLVPGVLINRGIGPTFSVADVNGSGAWIQQSKGGDRAIVIGDGFGPPKRISNHAVEHALQGYSTVDDAVSMSYEWEGHLFYQVNFPTADDSWAFDVESGEWHKPLFWNTTTAAWERSRIQYHAFDGVRHLMGDRATGTIYALSGTVYTDAGGAPLRRLRRCPLPRLSASSDFFTMTYLQILMDVGVGLVSGQGVDPQVMRRISRDGGKTWGNEHWVSAGAMGKWLTRVDWNRVSGRFRDGMCVLEIVVSDPVPFRFIGAEFDAKRLSA